MGISRNEGTACPCCDGISNPLHRSHHYGDGRLLLCIRGTTLVVRAVDQPNCPQWLLDVKYCPECGRKLGVSHGTQA